MSRGLKQRTAHRRPFALSNLIWSVQRLDLLHPLDALSAEYFLYDAATLHDLNLLKVRSELSPGRFHRKTAPVPKLSRLSTTFTLRHLRLILSHLFGLSICKLR